MPRRKQQPGCLCHVSALCSAEGHKVPHGLPGCVPTVPMLQPSPEPESDIGARPPAPREGNGLSSGHAPHLGHGAEWVRTARVLERRGGHQKAELRLQWQSAPVGVQQVQALLRQRGGGNQGRKAKRLKPGWQ